MTMYNSKIEDTLHLILNEVKHIEKIKEGEGLIYLEKLATEKIITISIYDAIKKALQYPNSIIEFKPI